MWGRSGKGSAADALRTGRRLGAGDVVRGSTSFWYWVHGLPRGTACAKSVVRVCGLCVW